MDSIVVLCRCFARSFIHMAPKPFFLKLCFNVVQFCGYHSDYQSGEFSYWNHSCSSNRRDKAGSVVTLLQNCTEGVPAVSQPALVAFPIVLCFGIGGGYLASQRFCVKRVLRTPLAIESAVQETVAVTEARFPLAISSSSAAKPYIPRPRRHGGATNNRRYEVIGHRRAPDPSVL